MKIIIFLTAVVFAFLVAAGVILSIAWPSTWSPVLQSLGLNIIASLIGVVAGIFTAIFIIEKYLEHERMEAKKKREIEEALYQEHWKAYIYGGVSILSALITHFSIFIAYGRDQYLVILEADGDTNDVPTNIGDFISWLIVNLKVNRVANHKEGEKIDVKDYDRGMNEQDAERIKNEFNNRSSSPLACTFDDVVFLSRQLRKLSAHLRDQIFIFQPFLLTRMEFGIMLVQLAHSLDEECDNIDLLVDQMAKTKNSENIIKLNQDFTDHFRVVGKQAVGIMNLMWTYAKEWPAY